MSIKDSLEGLRSIDLNDLDLNNVGSWPGAVKFVAGLLLLILVLALEKVAMEKEMVLAMAKVMAMV